MASLLVPPTAVRGHHTLERDAFTTTMDKMPCLSFDKVVLNEVMPVLKKYLLKIQGIKPVQSTSNKTIVYLDPAKVQTPEDFPESDKKLLLHQGTFHENKLELKYENWNSNQVLRAVLPDDIEVPTSYSQIGHIIHLNLREVHFPYKFLIGQVYLDKISRAKTVVNKLTSIETTFRNFAMEILAGEENTIVSVKENGCTYHFDFATVYWNPRLCTEHNLLLTFMKPKDVLYDVFAGVGPFAIPAAKKGVEVLANDLNPESYKWLIKNAAVNKVKSLTAFNKDGRDFLKNDVKNHILNRRKKDCDGNEHIAMNLPAIAVEFLDVFFNWSNREENEEICKKPPMIHVYCFVKLGKHDDPSEIAKLLVQERTGAILCKESLVQVQHVRNVSPNKEMMRVSFLLNQNILHIEEPAKKKLKADLEK